MPLLERARVEVYVPDLPSAAYPNLLRSFEEEFTYAFGGCTIIPGLEGSYLSETGKRVPDNINLIYSDLPLALSTNFDSVARYVGELRRAAMEALPEEAILTWNRARPHSSTGTATPIAALALEWVIRVSQNYYQREITSHSGDEVMSRVFMLWRLTSC